MTKQVEVTASGKAFNVNLPDIKKEQAWLEKRKGEVEEGEVVYNRLWTEEASDLNTVIADLTHLQMFLDAVTTDPTVLVPQIDEIRKKKNGGFWRKSGVDVKVADNCTEYFTDFTNAWRALVIRLDVDSEDTCTLSVRERTFTY